MLVTFLGLSCASCFFSLKFFGLFFYFNEFHQKKSFYVFALFPFYIFCFQLFRFQLQQQQQRRSQQFSKERETCLLNSALSLSLALFFCFTLFRARSPSLSLSSHTQLCWLSENIKNARETFCSKLLTTFIISMCVCVCVAIVYQQIASAARLLNSVDTHSILFSFTQTHFFYFSCSTKHKRLSTHCAGRQTEFNCCSSDKTTK